MKKIFFLFVLWYSCNVFAQAPGLTRWADSLLKPGTYTAAFIKYEFAQPTKDLLLKAIGNLKKNHAYQYNGYITLLERGDKSVVHKKEMGLTEEEFITMKEGFKKGLLVVPADSFTITIKKKANIITFDADKKGKLFNSLKIDCTKKEVHYENVKCEGELFVEGKNWSPLLLGYESNGGKETGPEKKEYISNGFSFTLGINKGYNFPTLSLMILPDPAGPPQFNIISILQKKK